MVTASDWADWQADIHAAIPHGPDEPCTCKGCWACRGGVVGCPCDIDWDRASELRNMTNDFYELALEASNMSYKISFDTCYIVIDALDLRDTLFPLDVRLGLEQLQDAVGFADWAHERWVLADPTTGPECPEEILNLFRLVTRRTQVLTVDQVWTGFQSVVDSEEFQESCRERWEAIGEDYSGHEGLVELGAMPNPEDLPA